MRAVLSAYGLRLTNYVSDYRSDGQIRNEGCNEGEYPVGGV
jgi:hypothetical protein